jgi:S-adenosylmethionine-diacylglycerol 3-amino-3-carboxypropyl transferase
LKDWVEQAAGLPVAFAVVREDPRLDLEVLDHLGERPRVVMIASGGETALCLARRPLASLTLVDLNPAQLELVRLKWQLAAGPRERALQLLGHGLADRRDCFRAWGLEDGRLGPFEQICAWGLDYLGRYEAVFRDLQSHGDFQRSFALENLVRLFGEGATQNPRRSFASHFEQRCQQAAARPEAGHNPFLSQVLHGCFPPQVAWDWLAPETWGQPLLEPVYRHGEMHELLRRLPDGSADFVHLSNILDWLSPEQASAVLSQAARVLAPGGVVLLRQLNSSLDIVQLPAPLSWNVERGRRLAECDRSFFYAKIHWGQRL